MIKIIARRVVRAENIEQYEALARELVEKSQAEAGNVSYTLNKRIADPQVHTFIEIWKDQAAIDAHNASEHFTRLVPQLGALVEQADPVELYTELSW